MEDAVSKKNVDRKKNCSNVKQPNMLDKICRHHYFSKNQVQLLQGKLLKWYDDNQRILPWRDIAKTETDPDKRGYGVWVSEVMLQQTQVASVIPYYQKWMVKWPSVNDLAVATLEEVFELWSGLGYYSRAKRLHMGAQIVTEKLQGHFPHQRDDLMKLIPGIGKYTASAISSVAYQQVVGVVDGNVSRVLSRLRGIGHDMSKLIVTNHFWSLANDIVSVERPGDFNQALMELGALICTPRQPKCCECPLNTICVAYLMTKNENCKNTRISNFIRQNVNPKSRKKTVKEEFKDIEKIAECNFCLPAENWKENPSVMVFPVKAKKKESRKEIVNVVIIESQNQLLITKRPDSGLLANLWEFPNITFNNDSHSQKHNQEINDMLQSIGIPPHIFIRRKKVTEVIHIFSHIHTTYFVEYLPIQMKINLSAFKQPAKWLTRDEFHSSAVSTAMKKVLAAVDKYLTTERKTTGNRKKRKTNHNFNQLSIKKYITEKL